MNFIDIILTTDKRFYIGPAWSVQPGDMIGATNSAGERVVKTVEEVLTKDKDSGGYSFLKKFVGGELKRIDTVFTKKDAEWPKEEQDVSE